MTARAEPPREDGSGLGDRSAALNEARRRIENLETALQTNRRIGVAIGILMSRHGLSEDDAFALLAKASQLTNRKLRDIAEEVAYQGDLPRRTAKSPAARSESDLGAVG
jgi:ANTAR domain-containing protein